MVKDKATKIQVCHRAFKTVALVFDCRSFAGLSTLGCLSSTSFSQLHHDMRSGYINYNKAVSLNIMRCFTLKLYTPLPFVCSETQMYTLVYRLSMRAVDSEHCCSYIAVVTGSAESCVRQVESHSNNMLSRLPSSREEYFE